MGMISVITPTFNREELLDRCVKHVMEQKVSANVEHIIVNDFGKPLRHKNWQEDPRIRIVNTHRVERAIARNTGASIAQGEWLYFLDDDDYPESGAFEKLLTAGQKYKASLVYGAYQIFNQTDNVILTIRPDASGYIFPMVFSGETIPLQATFMRRNIFVSSGGFDPMMVPAEDVDLIVRLCRQYTVHCISDIVSTIRVNHPSTTTTSVNRSQVVWKKIPEKSSAAMGTIDLLLRATRKDPYWAGRCARSYLAVCARYLQEKRYDAGIIRLCQAALLSRQHGMNADFWRGIRRTQRI